MSSDDMLQELREYIAPYSGDVSEVRFYITTDNGVDHAQAFVQALDDEGHWHAAIIDGMGFSQCYHGGRTPFDVRGCKPYFMTKSLDTAMPFIDKMKGEYIERILQDAGFDPAPVVTRAQTVVEEAAVMGDRILVLTSRMRGSERYFRLYEFFRDGFRWRSFEDQGDMTIREDLPRIGYDEARELVLQRMTESWDSKLDAVRRWVESASEAKTRRKVQ